MTPNMIMLIISACFLAFITSGRLFWVLGRDRWGFSGESHVFFFFVSGGVAALVMGFIATAAIQSAGIIGGVASVLAAIPMAGFAWIFVVGGNKALERVLSGLIRKLDK